jgi:hypothetical protein
MKVSSLIQEEENWHTMLIKEEPIGLLWELELRIINISIWKDQLTETIWGKEVIVGM